MAARAISCASAPESRTIDSAPRPGAVAGATMVSENRDALSAERCALGDVIFESSALTTVRTSLGRSALRAELDGFPRLDDSHGRAQMMVGQSLTQSTNRIVRSRRHMTK